MGMMKTTELAPSDETSTTNGDLLSSTPSSLSSAAPAVIIAPPLGIDSQEISCCGSDSKQKNIVLRVLDILKGVRPGSDLTSFQVPPQFNLPKSQLQCYAEQVYCCGQNLLEQCADGATPLDRFLAVVRWHISLTRPAPFAKAPYNPILGETHHVTSGDLNLLIEQVSHHPPISALYATNPKKKIEVYQVNEPFPRFCGGSVEVAIGGRRTLVLAEEGETYEMTSPKLAFRLLPNPSSEWAGETVVRCVQTGLEAAVTFKPRSFLGFRGGCNQICGTVMRTSSRQVLYTLSGGWDKSVILQDKETGRQTELYNGVAALSNLKMPLINDQQAMSTMESVIVWSKLTEGVWNQDWETARVAKMSVEEKQRVLRIQRLEAGEKWTPKYFVKTTHGEWEWAFKGRPVPEGPIVG